MKIAVAAEKDSLDSEVCEVSGRAPYYMVFEDGKHIKTLRNPFAVGGGGAGFGVARMLSKEGIDMAVSGKFGGNMISAMEEKGMKHKTIKGISVKDAIGRVS